MRISDEKLDYWADRFCELGLARYLTFSAFIQRPEAHLQRILGSNYRPMLFKQRAVAERLAELGRYDIIERLDVHAKQTQGAVR